MMDKDLFRARVNETLDRIGPQTLAYDKSEFWMLERCYHYVENYAWENRLYNTTVALPLARALHNGVHRKGTVLKDGVAWRLPYVIHCLMVCRALIDLHLPMSSEEEDVLFASALCHDIIEDVELPENGRELITVFGLDPKVYEIVKILSKRKDFTEEEHRAYFNGIVENRYALLIKLADRSNNVEDLYNMKTWKINEYVKETRDCIFPMCGRGIDMYVDLAPSIQILWEKMVSLTEMAEILAERYDTRERELVKRIEELQKEQISLRAQLHEMGAE